MILTWKNSLIRDKHTWGIENCYQESFPTLYTSLLWVTECMVTLIPKVSMCRSCHSPCVTMKCSDNRVRVVSLLNVPSFILPSVKIIKKKKLFNFQVIMSNMSRNRSGWSGIIYRHCSWMKMWSYRLVYRRGTSAALADRWRWGADGRQPSPNRWKSHWQEHFSEYSHCQRHWGAKKVLIESKEEMKSSERINWFACLHQKAAGLSCLWAYILESSQQG